MAVFWQELVSAMEEEQENNIKEFYLEIAATESLDAKFDEVVKSHVEKYQEAEKQYRENETVIQAEKALKEATTAATKEYDSAMQKEQVTWQDWAEAVTTSLMAQADAMKTYEESIAEASKPFQVLEDSMLAAFVEYQRKCGEAIELAKNDTDLQAKAASMRAADEMQVFLAPEAAASEKSEK